MQDHPTEIGLLRQDMTLLHRKLDLVLASVSRTYRRRDLSEVTKRKHIETVEESYDGRCPCCWSTRIVKDGVRTNRGVFDHWTDNPSKNRSNETWLICQDCNAGFSTGTMVRRD
jgi:hypothetical protein